MNVKRNKREVIYGQRKSMTTQISTFTNTRKGKVYA
jgi:hypothetical protein